MELGEEETGTAVRKHDSARDGHRELFRLRRRSLLKSGNESSSTIATAANVEGPVRCEPEDGVIDGYVCFGREWFGDKVRYASCATTQRCQVLKHGALLRGFWLGLTGDEGHAVRMQFTVPASDLGYVKETVPKPPDDDDD